MLAVVLQGNQRILPIVFVIAVARIVLTGGATIGGTFWLIICRGWATDGTGVGGFVGTRVVDFWLDCLYTILGGWSTVDFDDVFLFRCALPLTLGSGGVELATGGFGTALVCLGGGSCGPVFGLADFGRGVTGCEVTSSSSGNFSFMSFTS